MNTPGPNVEPQASASGDRWLTGLTILLYGGLILAAVWAHEPWRDEAQTWLIGRDATLQAIRRSGISWCGRWRGGVCPMFP